MNQLIRASLSHTHYWYEVGILKVVPAIYALDTFCMTHAMTINMSTTTTYQKLLGVEKREAHKNWSGVKT